MDAVNWIIAGATVVYAVSAIVLAVVAWLAHREGQTGRREDHELAVMPYLAAQMERTVRADQTVELSIAAVNVSSHPALRVTIELLEGPWDRLPPTESKARALRESPRFYAVIPATERRAFLWKGIPVDELRGPVTVRMRYLGPMGGTVWQTYALDQGAEATFSFKDLQRFVLASAPGAKPIIT